MALTSWICLALGLAIAQCAPIDFPIGAKPHRESTKEILNLEQQLKAQAGEGKTFYPSQQRMPFPPPGDAPPQLAADPLLDGKDLNDEIEALFKAEMSNGEGSDNNKPAASEDKSAELDHKNSPTGNGNGKEEDIDLPADKKDDGIPETEVKVEHVPEEDGGDYGDKQVTDNQEQKFEGEDQGLVGEEDEEEQDDEENEFLKNVIKSLHKHPELMQELTEYPDVPAMPGSDFEDQEEDIRNEYMLAEREREREQGEYTPYGDNYEDDDDYYGENEDEGQGYEDASEEDEEETGDEARIHSYEPFQKYDGDRLGKVVAKKWSLDSPEEVYKQYYRGAESDEEDDTNLEHDDVDTETDDVETDKDEEIDTEENEEEDETNPEQEGETEKVAEKGEDVNATSDKSGDAPAIKEESSDVLVPPIVEEGKLDKVMALASEEQDDKPLVM